MTDPIERTARGRDEATPARALLGVALTVWAVAGIFTAVLLLLWWLLAR